MVCLFCPHFCQALRQITVLLHLDRLPQGQHDFGFPIAHIAGSVVYTRIIFPIIQFYSIVFSIPAIILSSVDLPHPLGSSKTKNFPASISKSIPLSAFAFPRLSVKNDFSDYLQSCGSVHQRSFVQFNGKLGKATQHDP